MGLGENSSRDITFVYWQNTTKIWMDELPSLTLHFCFSQEIAKQLGNISEIVRNKLMSL